MLTNQQVIDRLSQFPKDAPVLIERLDTVNDLMAQGIEDESKIEQMSGTFYDDDVEGIVFQI